MERFQQTNSELLKSLREQKKKDYQREYRANHKEELAQKKRAYQQKTKEKYLKQQAVWRSLHKHQIHEYSKQHWAKLTPDERKAINQYQKEWRLRNREKESKRHSLAFHKQKHEVLSHYSKGIPICAWPHCGWTDEQALSIDHIKGGGRAHIKKFHIKNLYRWLRLQGFPEGFQVLCMNHQFVKRATNGETRKKEVVG